MSLLSSYSLFHFTPTLDNLESILRGGLKYSWVAEKLPARGIGYLLQTVCFCNIPLSMIEEHVEWYGKYAIGFRRSILRKKGASSVFYMHSDTALLYKGKNRINNYANERFLPYFKLFYGKQHHPGSGAYKYKKFYDEKEWRLFDGTPEVIKYKDLNDLENQRLKKKRKRPEPQEYVYLSRHDRIHYPGKARRFDSF